MSSVAELPAKAKSFSLREPRCDASAIEEAARFIRQQCPTTPAAGIVLGTGLGDLARFIEADAVIDYCDIPHFCSSTALAHQGRLVCGRFAGVAPVVAMQGRIHLYEGYSPQQIVLPIRVMHALGAKLVILTNASGGLNPKFAKGDIVVMNDHINLMWASPLLGPNDDALGPRFPDMSRTYSSRLIEQSLKISRQHNFAAHAGVYAGMTGPCYETRAEYRLLRRLGADCVGMSTVPEAIAAAHCGLEVLALSIVTNVAKPDSIDIVSAEEVLHDAQAAETNVGHILRGVLACGEG